MTKIVFNGKSTSNGFFYAPYIPMVDIGMNPYKVIKKIQDTDGWWYTISITNSEAVEWLVNQAIGSWRYAANPKFSIWIDHTMYDIREDVYNWFLLRWS